MRYLLLLILFLTACNGEPAQPMATGATDTFLQRMAANASQADARAGNDIMPDCSTVLYWMLLTSDLSKKNKGVDTVVHIHPHAYTIAHTSSQADTMLIWISYKPDDSAATHTLAWLQLDTRTGDLFDATAPAHHPARITFDTAQLSALKCACLYSTDTAAMRATLHHRHNTKMIRNTRYTATPDYGKVF